MLFGDVEIDLDLKAFLIVYLLIQNISSHIEQIPIPVVSKNIQEAIENLVDNILVSTEEEYQNLCEELDYKISKIYTLTEAEISMVSC